MALTAAALALQGLLPDRARAEGSDGATFSLAYHHYSEGARELDGQTYAGLNLKPLQADSLALSLTGTLLDKIDFGLNYSQDTWSGATPVTTLPFAAVADQITSGASIPTAFYEDSNHHPVDVDWTTYDGVHVNSQPDNRLVHVMASASPETRRQIDGRIGIEGEDSIASIGGGISEEPDYHSRFLNAGIRWDFDQKLTTLDLNTSITGSTIDASLDANNAADWGAYLNRIFYRDGGATLFGNRRDYAETLSLARVINSQTLLESSIGFTLSKGYLSNPYKATVLAFDDPDQIVDSTGLRTVVVKGTLEQRPEKRKQWTWDTRLVHHFESIGATLHFDYRLFHDDWNITAHTLDLSWYQSLGDDWMLTPGVRYYSQSAAFFYKPYFLFDQAFPILLPRNPELPPQLDHSKIQIPFFSSDERLSGFGSVSASFAVRKPILRYAVLEIGAEYTRHAGSLKLGDGGEKSFADFNALSTYLTLDIDMKGQAEEFYNWEASETDSDDASETTAARRDPLNLAFDRPLPKTGAIAATITQTIDARGGPLQHYGRSTDDGSIVHSGCEPGTCYRVPKRDLDSMSTFELSYAALDWLTVSLSPTFVTHHEEQRALAGAPFPPFGGGPGATAPPLMHNTGGLGDTSLRATAAYVTGDSGTFLENIALHVPTGSIASRVNKSRAFENYGLQPGSGTWDVETGLGYIIDMERLTLGAELSGRLPISGKNADGYRMGESAALTGWSGYGLTDWLSATLSGTLSSQGQIHGQFGSHLEATQTGYRLVHGRPVPTYTFTSVAHPVLGTMDNPQNYGGQLAEIGIGVQGEVPDGILRGNRFGIEWLQPVWQRAYGYQLSRKGTATLSWSQQF